MATVSKKFFSLNYLCFIALCLCFVLGNTASFPLPGNLILRPLDIIVGFFWLIAIFKNKFTQIFPLPWLFLFFSGISLLINSSRLAQSEFLYSFAYLYRYFLYAFVVIPLSSIFSIRLSRLLCIILPVLIVLTGLIQYLFIPDTRFLATLGWDDHYYRVISSLLDPGFSGVVISLGLLCLLIFKPFTSSLNIVIWAISFIALLLTYSRASFLSFAMGVISYALWYKKYRLSLLILISLAGGILLLPRPGGEGVKLERSSTVFARLTNWANSLLIIKDHPVVGVGLNTYRFAQRDRGFLAPSDWSQNHSGNGSDSSLLFVTATTGLVGLALYLFFLKQIFFFSKPLRVIVLSLLVHSAFLNSLFYSFVLVLLALILIASQNYEST